MVGCIEWVLGVPLGRCGSGILGVGWMTDVSASHRLWGAVVSVAFCRVIAVT